MCRDEVEQLNYLDLPQRGMVLISIGLLQHDEMSRYRTHRCNCHFVFLGGGIMKEVTLVSRACYLLYRDLFEKVRPAV